MSKNHKKQEIKRVGVSVKHLKTYVHLFRVANLASKRTQEGVNEFSYDSMSCILFCALSLEAYLNHVGAEEFQFWEDGLESLKPSAKLQLIASERLETEAVLAYGLPRKRKPIKISIDCSRRPFQSFGVIFGIRNQLAHGKTEWVLEAAPNNPKAKWEKYCTPKQAMRFLEDTEEMITIIHSKLYQTTQDPFTFDLNFFGTVTV